MLELLKLLLWKNWKIKSRNKYSTATEIFSPVLLVSFYIFIRMSTHTTEYRKFTEFPEFSISGNVPPVVRTNCTIIYYTPKNNLTTRIMDKIDLEFFKKEDLNYTFQGFPNKKMMEKSYKNSVTDKQSQGHRDTSPVLAGIVFDKIVSSLGNNCGKKIESGNNNIEYTIKMPGLQRTSYDPAQRANFLPGWYEDLFYLMLEPSGPREYKSPHGGFPGYYDEGFLYLQYALDFTMTQMLMGRNETLVKFHREMTTDIKLQRFPFPPYTHDYLPILIAEMQAFFVIACLVYFVMSLTSQIIEEKSSRLKIPLRSGVASVQHSNAIWIFIPHILYSIPVIGYSFLFSTLFSQPDSGATAAGLSWIMQFFTFHRIFDKMQQMSRLKSFLLIILVPSGGLNVIIELISTMENMGVGADWSNIWTGMNGVNHVCIGDCCIATVITGTIMMLLAFYIEQAFPGNFGVPLPWYFPLTTSYWTGKAWGAAKFLDQNSREFPPESTNPNVETASDRLKVGVNICRLSKVFKSRHALNSLTVKIHEGQVTSVLGHNGAGKTTTMSILTGLIQPSDGTAYINDLDIRWDMQHIRSSLGLCPQYNVLFSSLTVEEHLKFFCKLKRYGRAETINEIDRVLSLLKLEDKRHAQAKTLSGGMKRKLCVGIAFSAGSKVVFLDEPTAGMDLEARRDTWDLIQSQKIGRTIILSSHYMEEAELLGDRIMIMFQGTLQCCGSPLFLRQKYGDDYNLDIVRKDGADIKAIRHVLETNVPSAMFLSNMGTKIKFILPRGDLGKFPEVFQRLEYLQHSLGISSLAVSSISMEDIFLRVENKARETKRPQILNYGRNYSLKNPDSGSTSTSFSLGQSQAQGQPDRRSGQGTSTNIGHSTLAPSVNGIDRDFSTASINPAWAEDEDFEIDHQSQSSSQIYHGNHTQFSVKAVTGSYNSGWKLLHQQFEVLIRKKIWITIRRWELVCLQIFLPMALVAYGIFCIKAVAGFHEPAPLVIDQNNYALLENAPFPFRCQLNDESFCKKIETFTRQHTKLNLKGKFNSSVYDFVREKAAKDTVDFHRNYVFALELNESRSHNKSVGNEGIDKTRSRMEIRGYFNNQPLHSPPFLLNYVSNALLYSLGQFSPSGTKPVQIKAVNSPFAENAVDIVNLPKDVMSVGFLVGTVIDFALTFFIAAFVVLPLEEKQCKFTDLAVMAGAHKGIYWLTNFIIDLILCILGMLGVLVVVWMFNIHELHSWEASIQLLILFFVFGVSGICSAMFVSTFATNPAATYCRLTFFHLTAGNLLHIISVFFDSPEVLDIQESAAETFREIFTYVPVYSVSNGFQKVFRNHQLHQSCPSISNLRQFCQNQPEYPCCSKYQPSYFAWKGEGIGKELFGLVIVSLVSLILLVLYEMKILHQFKIYFSMFTRRPNDALIDSYAQVSKVDDEVTMEDRKITQSHITNLRHTNVLLIRNVCKLYKKTLLAVHHLNLGVNPGEVFGLLGTNGAGKTTTFKMLIGEVVPSFGDIYINSFSVRSDLKRAHAQIGYCPQFDATLGKLTGMETLVMFANLKGLEAHTIPPLILRIADSLLFTQFLNMRVESYSGGNKRKLSTALSLIGDPPLILLDEPTAGMDPEARKHVWNAINLAKDDGAAVLLTSHLMEECEALCSRLGIMVKGRFKSLGSPQQLKSKLGKGYSIIARLSVQPEFSLSTDSNSAGPSSTAGTSSSKKCVSSGDNFELTSVKAEKDAWSIVLKKFHSFLTKRIQGCILKESHTGYVRYTLEARETPWLEIFDAMEEAKRRFRLKSYAVGQVDLENVFLHCIQSK